MDDKLIRLARKVKTLEDELSKITQIKDLEGLLFVNTDITNKYKKAINETVNIYKDYISNTEKELTNSIQTIKKEHREKTVADTKQIQLLETKIAQIKEDIQKVCTSIDKSIEDIQKDILKDIKDKNTQILNEIGKKDKELKEVKQENIGLVKDLKALKDLVNKLELQKGEDGKSAYDIACELGFKGTKEEWIKSLHGKDGQDIELRGLRAFSDVKNDNKMYARKNKKWVEVENYDDTEIREDIAELQEENEAQTEQITALQTENARLKATLPTTTGSGTEVTLDKTAELEFIQPTLPRGNSEQVQYSGKNKFTAGTGETRNTGVTANYNESEIKLNGTTTRGGNIFLDNTLGTLNSYRKIGTFPAGTYFLSFTKLSGSLDFTNGGQSAFYIRKGNDIGNQLITIDITADTITKTGTITLAEEATLYCQYYVNKASVVYNNYLFRIQIEQGSTATSYEPYCGGTESPNPSFPSPIQNVTGDVEVLVQNKNLFDKNNANILQAYINSTTKTIINLETARTLFIGCKPNTTYTVSRKAGQRFIVMSTIEIPSYNIIGTIEKHNNTATKLTITTGANDKYLAVFYYLSTADTITEQEILDSIQIEQNSTATTYTPHKEQTLPLTLGNIELCKIGDYQDYFYKENSKWYLYKDFDKYTITGNENISAFEVTSNGCFAVRLGIKCRNAVYSGSTTYWLATTLKPYSLGNLRGSDPNIGICVLNDNYTYINLTAGASTLANVTTLFANLAGTDVYYLKQNPTITEITDTTLINQLEAIKQALSYEEQTNISGSSDESNPLFSVEAYQSIKLILAS